MSVHDRRAAAAAVWLATALLAACASRPQPPAADSLTGRLTVRVERAAGDAPRSLSAGFDLSGDAARGGLSLSTPLGTRLAQAVWSPGQVVLLTAEGEKPYPDLNALTRELVGEALPVAAFFDWLRGRPWPGASSSPLPPPEDGFSQLGWQVMLAGFERGAIVVRREAPPAVVVRAIVDRPQ